jgi:3-oxoacyl-[acyl-carrier protein] reductase
MIKYVRVKKMDRKVVLVTGSGSGLGKNIIEKFAQNNYDVVITYLTHEKEALKFKEEIEQKYHVNTLCCECDISINEDVDYLFKKVINTFGRIDVLVNNAAISLDTTIEDKTKDNFMRILEVNVYGTFYTSKVFGKYMKENKNGKIINIASTNGIDTYYEYSIDYDASKAAVINMTHNLANHLAPYVNVNCVCPGWINTPMNENMDKEFREKEENKILLNRFAEPEEIANLVYFLATDEANLINDSIIRIDGGIKC